MLSNKEGIFQICIPDSIEWHIVPPNTPHMGGLWEACVKSVKHYLYQTMGNEILTYEEVFTLLIKIETYFISRPITVHSNGPNDEQPLTPAHFLVSDSIILPMDQTDPNITMNRP